MDPLRTYGLECIEPAESLPVSVDAIKANSRLDCLTEDQTSTCTQLITEATQWLQKQTEAALITSSWRWTLDQFPRTDKWLSLPVWPVQSIESVQYRDVNNALVSVSLADLILRKNDGGRCRIALANWATWPSAKLTPDAVKIEFTAGFGDAATDVPAIWKRPILMLASHWFENAEAASVGVDVREVPFGVNNLIATLRDPDDMESFDLE